MFHYVYVLQSSTSNDLYVGQTELEYYLDFPLRLELVSKIQYALLVELREETGRLLHGLIGMVKK